MANIELVIKISQESYNNIVIKNEYTNRDIISLRNALMDAMFFQSYLPDHERKFERIIVVYPPEESTIYTEYKGKPYFLIQYEENGEHFVGFGTYKPEVLSRYLTEYFISPMISKDNIRDCKTCVHSKDGKCSYTEECHECMFENKYVKADKKGEQE